MIVRSHKKQSGVTKEQVLAMHAAHPTWNAARIARELKCVAGYVRATLKRAGKTNPGHRPPPKKKPRPVLRANPAPHHTPEPPRREQRPFRPYWID